MRAITEPGSEFLKVCRMLERLDVIPVPPVVRQRSVEIEGSLPDDLLSAVQSRDQAQFALSQAYDSPDPVPVQAPADVRANESARAADSIRKVRENQAAGSPGLPDVRIAQVRGAVHDDQASAVAHRFRAGARRLVDGGA